MSTTFRKRELAEDDLMKENNAVIVKDYNGFGTCDKALKRCSSKCSLQAKFKIHNGNDIYYRCKKHSEEVMGDSKASGAITFKRKSK